MKLSSPTLSFPLTALVLAVLSLSACSTLQPSKPVAPSATVAVPADWSASTASASTTPNTPTALADWWSRFNDPQLTGLVTQALLANTDVQTAQAALQQSRALRDAKVAGLGPSIGASASAQRSYAGTGPSGTSGNSFSAGFDASWEPDIFGGKHNAADATQADADAAQTSLGNVRVSVAAEVAVAYIELRGLQAQVAIAQSNLQSQTETLQITQWRAQAGLTTSLEVEQARTAVAQTAAQVPTLQASVSKTLHSLAVLTGQAPAALVRTLAAVQPVPQAPADLALSLPADTLRQRPDVRAAELKVTAALARVSEAEAARYPSFSLSKTLGLKALTLGALTDGASLVSSLLASVSVPLFDGGAAKAQVRAQEAALAQTHVAYQATVLTALKDVEDALVALQGDRSRLVELQTAADAASNAALLASQRYQSGLIDFQTVLTTQRTLLGAQDNVASTVADVSADHVRLYKALGGGWN